MALVDVIVPVYNTPQGFLTVALDSLRAQTFSDWMAWVINDGSDKLYTVELEETLKAYSDSRLHYLYSDHKEFDGVKMPTKEVILLNGAAKLSEVKFNNYKVLSRVEDKLFEKP